MATTTKSGSSLNYWRNYFRTANSDIFGLIDRAIMVAAVDCPKEFKLRRDRIAERLFSCRLTRCLGCEKVELLVPGGGDHDDDDDDDDDEDRDGGEVEAGGNKQSKVNSSGDDQLGDMNTSNYSDGLAEALTDEIEEESQIFGEVLRIKEIFQNSEHESEAVLLESLRKLELMGLSVETLKATEIGKAVNRLRKHGSMKIRSLVRTLIDAWKVMVDEWVNATTAIASAGTEVISDSADPSSVDDDYEEGLPTPPLDEGAFFATQTTSMELSEFFDGMEDYGNPRNSGQFTKNRENGTRPYLEKQNIEKQEQQYVSDQGNVLPKEINNEPKKQEVVVKPNRPSSNTNSGPRRPPKVTMEQKGVKNVSKIDKKTDTVSFRNRQLTGQQDKFKCSDEVAVQVKLEATKRKLQESYQQAENAKRQRTVQVMELHDLPKQGLAHRNPHVKPGNHNRQRPHGRRF